MFRPISISVLFALISSACYSYTPIEGAVPSSGQEVRLELSDEGSVRMAPLIGPRISAIDGRALESNDTVFVLAVQGVVAQGGRTMQWSQERLSVPRTAVGSVRSRTLDRRKTWMTAALGVVGAIALSQVFGLGSGFDGIIGAIGGGGGKQ